MMGVHSERWKRVELLTLRKDASLGGQEQGTRIGCPLGPSTPSQLPVPVKKQVKS